MTTVRHRPARPSRALRPLRAASLGTLVVLLGTTFALADAATASAHVTASSSTTAAGGYATVTLKVPTESETASTTGLTVHLPESTPFTSVLTEPVSGWTATATTARLAKPVTDDDGNRITSAVTTVAWKATGSGLAPGEFGTFLLSLGPLPRSGTVQLPTEQHYSDGSTVYWVQQAQGSAEPEHPAPSITITRAAGAASAAPAAAIDASASTDRSGGTAAVLGAAFGGTGLSVAVLAVVLAALALRRVRRAPGGE